MGYHDHKQSDLFTGVDNMVAKQQYKSQYKSQDKYVFLGIAAFVSITFLIQWAVVLITYGGRL